MHIKQKPSPEVKQTACIAQRQDCIELQIWEEFWKQFCFIEVSQNHVVSFHMEEVWNNQDSS